MSNNSTGIGGMLKNHKDDNDVECLDPGEYRLEVISCKARATDIVPVYKVTAGPHTGKRVMAGVLSVNGGALGIFKQNMKGFGLGEDFWDSKAGDTLEGFADALKGRVVDVVLGTREWQNSLRNEIKIGAIKLVSAPPLPGPAGVPVVQQQAPSGVSQQVSPPLAASAAPPTLTDPVPPAPVAVAPPTPTVVAPPVQAQAVPAGVIPDGEPNF